MTQDSFVEEGLLSHVKAWRDYFAAKVGFKNHWYVAAFSRELAEGDTLTCTVLGEKLLMRRIRGKVYAMKDRCIHRGVKLSQKVDCYTDNTITCWYHGFTFRWTDGMLTNIVGAPESKLIGRHRIKVYPVEEAQGLIFVFVGDENYNAPPLSHDVPPTFLDADRVFEGESFLVEANWRSGPEGGIDEIHRYLHRDSTLLLNVKATLPLGHLGVKTQCEKIEAADGPKGIVDHFNAEKMYFDVEIDGVPAAVSGIRFADTGHKRKRTVSASCWLPGVLRVEGFPEDDTTFYEFYVPINETQHRCFMTMGRKCETEDEALQFRSRFMTRWRPYAIHNFLMQDVAARESTQQFYRHDRAWLEEVLTEEDFMIMEWRKLCARHHRGVQPPSRMD
ncbi:MAG TPA: Rieske 2Fe-2S domain-containing protein [Stellaceae bacterium]|nr:Rieske 2Fe-2S domain-containing protein [Stellaceae bacterium]